MTGTSTSQLRYTASYNDALWVATFTSALLVAQPAQAHSTSTLPANAASPFSLNHEHGWVSAQLSRIEKLESDWDGYGAEPIQPDLIRSMGKLMGELTQPETTPGNVVPGADGSLQAEWHTDRASFGLLLESNGALSSWVRPNDEPELEACGLAGRDLFQSAVFSYLV